MEENYSEKARYLRHLSPHFLALLQTEPLRSLTREGMMATTKRFSTFQRAPVWDLIDIIRNRRARLAAARRAGTPLGGVYWWIPVPNEDKTEIAGWKLQPFYDATAQEGGLHLFEWDKVLRFLQSAWQKDLSPAEDAYRSIPRGRVDQTEGPGTRLIPTLFHGGDTPAGHTITEIKHVFNLTNSARSLADDHERMVEAEQLLLFKLLVQSSMRTAFSKGGHPQTRIATLTSFENPIVRYLDEPADPENTDEPVMVTAL